MIGVLQKTWKKMTLAAHALALALSYAPHARGLLEKALKPAHEVGSASNNPGSA
jgi:EamA domain-containing membrane protein RarD